MSLYTYPCKILNVVDGDTLDIELDLGFNIRMKERVRLLGVDTPEVFGRNASDAGKIASTFAKDWLNERANTGSFMYISKKYDARDKYGRSLGIIAWTNEDDTIFEDLNQALLDSGNAEIL